MNMLLEYVRCLAPRRTDGYVQLFLPLATLACIMAGVISLLFVRQKVRRCSAGPGAAVLRRFGHSGLRGAGRRPALFLIGIAMLVHSQAAAQPTLQWTRQFGTSTFDSSNGVSADGLGNVYIGGVTQADLGGPSAGSFDAYVSKYDASGGLLWTRQIGTSEPTPNDVEDGCASVSADALGNVFVSGWTTGDLAGPNAGERDVFVRKYDASGVIQWTRQFGDSREETGNVAADGLGNVYVTGRTFAGSLGGPNAGFSDAYLSKYDTAGGLVWIRQFGTDFYDDATNVSADALGNVYVSGWTKRSLEGINAGKYDAFIRKYDASGGLLWTRQFGTSGDDYGLDVATDNMGDVYVVGETEGSLTGPNSGNFDAYVRKYNSSGGLLWARQFGTSGTDYGLEASTDSLGNVYIAGDTDGGLAGPNSGNFDAYVRMYNASGELLWTRQFGSAADDEVGSISADGLVSIYISGTSYGNLWGPSAGDGDAFLAKYSTVPEPGAIACVLAGVVSLVVVRRASLRCPAGFRSAGFPLTTPCRMPGGGTIAALLLASVAMSGASRAAAQPTLEWVRQFGTSTYDFGGKVSADGLGNVFISGDTHGSLGGPHAGGEYDAFVSKFNAAGAIQWTRQLGTSGLDRSFGVSADGLGNVYVSGITSGSLGGTNVGSEDAFVSKFDAAGALQWSRQLGTAAVDGSNGISADGLGNVYVTGYTDGSLGEPNAGGQDGFISKYDAAGALQWTRQLGTSANEGLFGVSADRQGNVYAVGGITELNSRLEDVLLHKFNAAGVLQWTRQFGTAADDVAAVVSADGSGNVYVSGFTNGSLGGANAGGYDAFLRKYDASGAIQWTQQFGTSANDSSGDVSSDGVGNVFVAGGTGGSLSGPNSGDNDVFVSKYDAGGVLQWTQQFGTSGGDGSNGVSADGRGNVYVAGGTNGSLGGPNAGDFDVILAKYSAAPEPTSAVPAAATMACLQLRRRKPRLSSSGCGCKL